MSKKIKLFIFSFINIFLLFRVDIFNTPYILYFLAIVGLLLIAINIRRYQQLCFFSVLLLMSIAFAIGVIAFNNTGEYSYPKMLVSIFFKIGVCFFSYQVFLLFFGKKGSPELYMRSYIISMMIVAISTLILIALPKVSDFWIGHIVPDNERLHQGYLYRKSIVGYTGFDELLIYTPALFFNIFFIAKRMNTKKAIFKYVVSFFILIVGCLFYGRSSIVTIGLSMILLLSLVKKKTKILKFFGWAFIFAAVGLTIMIIIAQYNTYFGWWMNWAFEPFIAFFTNSSIGSMESLSNMYIMPSTKTLFFGDGLFNTPEGYYMHSDVGLLRSIYFFGIFGLLLNLAMVIYLFVVCKKKCPKSIGIICVFILINVLIYEVKGLAFDACVVQFSLFYFICGDKKLMRRYRIAQMLRRRRRRIKVRFAQA